MSENYIHDVRQEYEKKVRDLECKLLDQTLNNQKLLKELSTTKKLLTRTRRLLNKLSGDENKLAEFIDNLHFSEGNTNITIMQERERNAVTLLTRFRSQIGLLTKKLSTLDKFDLVKTYLRNMSIAMYEEDWETIRRMSRNLHVTGRCETCSISTYGRKGHGRPNIQTMPCNLNSCPYEVEPVEQVNSRNFLRQFK